MDFMYASSQFITYMEDPVFPQSINLTPIFPDGTICFDQLLVTGLNGFSSRASSYEPDHQFTWALGATGEKYQWLKEVALKPQTDVDFASALKAPSTIKTLTAKGTISFYLSCYPINESGAVLPVHSLSLRVYLDDEVYDEVSLKYTNLLDNNTFFTYTPNKDEMISDIYLYRGLKLPESLSNARVEATLVLNDPLIADHELESARTLLQDDAAIEAIKADSREVSVKWYDLNGVELPAPRSGSPCLRVAIMSDGSHKVEKICAR